MPSRNVHVDDAHRRITEHVTLKGLALDNDPGDGTHQPKELAHASYPGLLLILLADMVFPRSIARARPRHVRHAVKGQRHRDGGEHVTAPSPISIPGEFMGASRSSAWR